MAKEHNNFLSDFLKIWNQDNQISFLILYHFLAVEVLIDLFFTQILSKPFQPFILRKFKNVFCLFLANIKVYPLYYTKTISFIACISFKVRAWREFCQNIGTKAIQGVFVKWATIGIRVFAKEGYFTFVHKNMERAHLWAMVCVLNRTGHHGQFSTKLWKQSFEPFFWKALKPFLFLTKILVIFKL